MFQDFKIFAFTIKENITADEQNGDIEAVLSQTGLSNFVHRWPVAKTCSGKSVVQNPSLILDEPTASLDIKAEVRFKANMKAVHDKTAIFISSPYGFPNC